MDILDHFDLPEDVKQFVREHWRVQDEAYLRRLTKRAEEIKTEGSPSVGTCDTASGELTRT